MKKQLTSYLFVGLSFASFGVFGQTEFKMMASDFEPHEDGFFLAGIDFDFNEDGVVDHVQGCPTGDFDTEDYERRDPANVTYDLHKESGEQFGFTYNNVMILPTCDPKYAPDSTTGYAPPQGYLQLRPGLDSSDLKFAHSYIASPAVRNIQSVTVEISADVSVRNSQRHIPFNIEISLDGGETYEFEPWVFDEIDNSSQVGGYKATFDENDPAMSEMIALSKTQNVVLRIITNPDNGSLGPSKGQYVKVHAFTIVADSAAAPSETVTGISPIDNTNRIQIKNNLIYVEKGTLTVHTISGRLVGSGSEVRLNKGLYIVTSGNQRKKVFIQ